MNIGFLATLHLDMFDSASGQSRRLLLLLSPDSDLGNTTLHCVSIVAWETNSNKTDP